MFKYIHKLLKYELSFFLWSYIPCILILIFGLLAVSFIPSFAIEAMGIFTAIVFLIMWFLPHKRK
jgi:uncharacterized membrane protein